MTHMLDTLERMDSRLSVIESKLEDIDHGND